jgi:hypothetical protein
VPGSDSDQQHVGLAGQDLQVNVEPFVTDRQDEEIHSVVAATEITSASAVKIMFDEFGRFGRHEAPPGSENADNLILRRALSQLLGADTAFCEETSENLLSAGTWTP